MRTAINVAVILLVGLVIGLTMRTLQPPSESVPTAERSLATGLDGQSAGDETTQPADEAGADDTALEVASSLAEATEPPAGEEWLTRFTLTERSGEKVSSEDLLGQPYVVSFFFSTCPSVCVMQNQKIQQLQKEFEGQGVRFVAISVDPETDTPEQLREYAARYKADEDQWLFLTGDLTYIRRVGGEVFRVAVNKKFHTEKLILVDPTGEISGYYTWSDERQFDELKADVREMIAGDRGAA